GLAVGAVKVAHHLGDGNKIARIDLGFVFLRSAAPHGALDAGAALERLHGALDDHGVGELAHTGILGLASRNPKGHFVLIKRDHEKFEPAASDLSLLDRDNAAYAVRRVYDVLVRLKTEARFTFDGFGHTHSHFLFSNSLRLQESVS